MSTPSGNPHQPEIFVNLGKNGNTYVAVGKNVDLIGEKRGSHIFWRFKNTLEDETLDVTLRNFSGDRCPVNFPGCTHTVRVQPGKREPVRARIHLTALPGRYTYEIHVHNPQTGHGNDIDPELQIDDGPPFHHLIKSPVVIGVAVVVLAALAYWFLG